MAASDPFRENEIQSWREMASELDETQVQTLKHLELHRAGVEPDQLRRELLDKAREFASQNLLGSSFGAIAPPDGAGQWFDWEGEGRDKATWQRRFLCAEKDFDGIRIVRQGWQRMDGTVSASTLVVSGHAELTPERCRELAAAIEVEAGELDGLTG
jgi:vacuolar-type H+-ATPase subunit C/Vma6